MQTDTGIMWRMITALRVLSESGDPRIIFSGDILCVKAEFEMSDKKGSLGTESKAEEPKSDMNLEDSKHDTKPASTADEAGKEASQV